MNEITALRVGIARRSVEQAIDDLSFAREAVRSLRDNAAPDEPRAAYRAASKDMDEIIDLLNRVGGNLRKGR